MITGVKFGIYIFLNLFSKHRKTNYTCVYFTKCQLKLYYHSASYFFLVYCGNLSVPIYMADSFLKHICNISFYGYTFNYLISSLYNNIAHMCVCTLASVFPLSKIPEVQ